MNDVTNNTNFQVMWLGGKAGGCEGGMMLWKAEKMKVEMIEEANMREDLMLHDLLIPSKCIPCNHATNTVDHGIFQQKPVIRQFNGNKSPKDNIEPDNKQKKMQ